MRLDLSGTGVALVTPFKGGEIDWEGLAQVIEHCYSGGIRHLIVMGTTGEAGSLSLAEKQALLRFVVSSNAGRMGVILGWGGNDTEALGRQLKSFDLTGVLALLSVVPYYNKPRQEGLYQHYMRLAELAPLPIILYNVPGRTACNLEAETTLRLLRAGGVERFAAIKEASGNLLQSMRIMAEAPAGFSLLSGDDNLTLALLALGARGVISVVGQAFPKTFSTMVEAGLGGDFVLARKKHYALMELTESLFAQGNPAGIKACLHHLGLIATEELRLPLCPIEEALRQQLRGQIGALLGAEGE